ncbi:MAG TPA: hypothetical protein VMS76_00690 [Planctomycetota bacterium]|jgi:hypothetical protein|nr:hypothetical protein [Planctomycetota bacterium]
MVDCQDCIHFREFPYDHPSKRKTGCYHPVHMVVKQTERFLQEQQIPGDHEKINLLGDCATFEARPPRPPLLRRLVEIMRS